MSSDPPPVEPEAPPAEQLAACGSAATWLRVVGWSLLGWAGLLGYDALGGLQLLFPAGVAVTCGLLLLQAGEDFAYFARSKGRSAQALTSGLAALRNAFRVLGIGLPLLALPYAARLLDVRIRGLGGLVEPALLVVFGGLLGWALFRGRLRRGTASPQGGGPTR